MPRWLTWCCTAPGLEVQPDLAGWWGLWGELSLPAFALCENGCLGACNATGYELQL